MGNRNAEMLAAEARTSFDTISESLIRASILSAQETRCLASIHFMQLAPFALSRRLRKGSQEFVF